LVAMVSNPHIGMVNELHMIASIMFNDWWYDYGATIHIYNNKNYFKDYEVIKDGQEVLIGNYNVAY